MTVLRLADVPVPRMADRGGRDAALERALDVDRAVVDQQVDAELAAARDLVVGAVQLVVAQADLRRSQRRSRRVAALGAVAGDVDEVAGVVPAR